MRKLLASFSLAFAGLLTTSAIAGGAGFMGDQAAAASGMYDQSQIQYIDGVAVVPVGNDTATSESTYDWKQSFNWQACGVKDFTYQPVQNCGGYYSSQCDIRRYYRACRFPCQQECIPHPSIVCNQTEVPVTPIENVTIPEIPVPSGNITPPTPIVITNCSYYKVCRERPRCNVDQSWWDYWRSDYEGAGAQQQGQCGCQQQPVCATPCQQKKQRRRICNATQDDSFDASTFKANNTYYDGCDCVVFQVCTNTTIVPPAEPIIPVPPIPSGGQACNYTCEDIRALHIVIANLSEQIQSQQSEIDMLIGHFQNQSSQNGGAAPSGGAGGENCCAQVAGINSDIAELYKVVNNITVDASEVTLQRIRSDGVRFGNNWWMGEQGAYLFAIDITQSSYYRFDSGVNRTL